MPNINTHIHASVDTHPHAHVQHVQRYSELRNVNAQAHVLLGHGGSKLLRVLGLLQQGLALRVEAIHLFQGAEARLQDEVAELGDLQLNLTTEGNSTLRLSIKNTRSPPQPRAFWPFPCPRVACF